MTSGMRRLINVGERSFKELSTKGATKLVPRVPLLTQNMTYTKVKIIYITIQNIIIYTRCFFSSRGRESFAQWYMPIATWTIIVQWTYFGVLLADASGYS